MPSVMLAPTPGIATFLKHLKHNPVDASIENFVSLLKRRQIRSSRPCAIATTHLLLKVVATFRDRDVAKLVERIRSVGQQLIAAQPREMAVGNIVRRVLGLVREIAEDDADENPDSTSMGDSGYLPHSNLEPSGLPTHFSNFSPPKHGSALPQKSSLSQSDSNGGDDNSGQGAVAVEKQPGHRPPLLTSHTSYVASAMAPQVTSLFGLLSHPHTPSPTATPPLGTQSPVMKPGLTSRVLATIPDASTAKVDIKAEVLEGIRELLDELDQADDQIAAYALDHIHSNEIILTHTSSTTVQRFLLAAARKRKFTVIHAEAYPNDHLETHATIMQGRQKSAVGDDEDERWSPLTALGITVIMIPDSAVFAIMSRVNKVILSPHTVLANGGLVAAAGALTIAQAASVHKTPVIAVSGVYKLSPVYPFDTEELIEYGDAGRVAEFQDGEMVESIEVVNPLFDYVSADLVDLYITNLGGHAPSYLYRIVADHYRAEDVNL
ncbi:GCD complex subunit gcd7 [Elasticomyces elasticus]|nr:GCD complex subunit gcd7 [Elasticomyces elasticus]KAK5001113.1 GCD complex subunit gcd7 [Elasticomyces elasticus]